jgi:hypothetical protein
VKKTYEEKIYDLVSAISLLAEAHARGGPVRAMQVRVREAMDALCERLKECAKEG